MKATKFVLVKHFDGMPKVSDFEVQEEELPPLKDGEALFEAVYLSVDPYMRPYSMRMPLGNTMLGQQVAKVIESRNSEYAVGEHFLGQFGWRTLTVSTGKMSHMVGNIPMGTVQKIFPLGGMSPSLAIGVVGMPGATAYLGLMKVGQLKAGETVFVNGSAGAVGSIVGQIARIQGCNVIGCAGTKEKCDWLKNELKFDHVINYKTCDDMSSAIKTCAPNGIDVYFDNVGGDMTDIIVTQHMKLYGRVVICGRISKYNSGGDDKVLNPYNSLLFNRLTIRGFIVGQFEPKHFIEAFTHIMLWIKEGQLQYREHVTEGFSNMVEAFNGLFKGDNIGKALVKV